MNKSSLLELESQLVRLQPALSDLSIERRDVDCGYFVYILYGPAGDVCSVDEAAVKRASEKAKTICAVLNAAPWLISHALSSIGAAEHFTATDPAHLPPWAQQPLDQESLFKTAWADKQAAGYRYGGDALEQVKFGWMIRAEYENHRIAELQNTVVEQNQRISTLEQQLAEERARHG